MLYAPGLRDGDEIRAVCEAVSKPVNVLAFPGLTIARARRRGRAARERRRPADVGRRRGAAEAAMAIRDEGDFSALKAKLQGTDWLR